MSRTVLFRAIRKDDNEWIESESTVSILGKRYLGFTAEAVENEFHLTWVEVHPETFAEYTGFMCTDNTKMFEGPCQLEIVGLGVGDASIVMHDGSWCIYSPSQGYMQVSEALVRPNIIIRKHSDL